MPTIKDAEKRERNSQLFFGCTEAVALAANGGAPLRHPRSYAIRYLCQRQAASARGIGWEITFPEWMSVWQESGKLHLRGKGIGSYCMARNGDQGPYKVENISIQLITQNSRDGIEVARAAINKTMRDRLGSGRGWHFNERLLKRPYQVYVAKKYVGAFATQGEAESAYQSHAESLKLAAV